MEEIPKPISTTSGTSDFTPFQGVPLSPVWSVFNLIGVRDLFALVAMHGLLVHTCPLRRYDKDDKLIEAKDLTEMAYCLADRMLEAMEEEK